MKVLITSVFFPPQNAVASQRPYVWARTWAAMGHVVTVLTISKDETKPDLTRKPFDGFEVIETPPGRILGMLRGRHSSLSMSVSRLAVGRPWRSKARAWLKKQGFMSSVRLPDAFDFWLPAARRFILETLRQRRFDVVVSTFGPHASLAVGYMVKRMIPSAKWVIDFRDLWTENHVYPGFWPLTIVERMLEGFYLRRCDGIVTVSEALAAALAAKAQGKPVFVSMNGFDPDEVLASPNTTRIHGDKLMLVYTGSLHPEQRNPAVLFQAIHCLSVEERERIEVVFAGPAPDFLMDLVNSLGLTGSVRTLGCLPRGESLRIQNEADVLLFFEKQHGEARDGVLTGKLFEYLITGRPIWAIGIDGTTTVGRLIEGGRAGHAFGSDVAAITSKLRSLLLSGRPHSRNTLDSSDVSRRFNREASAKSLIEWISSL